MKIKVHLSAGYTSISNEILQSKTLSLKAIGLLCKLLGLPDDWEYSASGLVSISKDGKGTITSALNELKDAGYLKIERVNQKNTDGKFNYIWHIFDSSEHTEFDVPLPKKPCTVSPIMVNEQLTQLSNNTINKNKKKIYKKRNFRKPTLEEIRDYCKERNNTVDPERFIDYYESVGWKIGSKPMKDWKASVRTWEKNQKSYDSTPQKQKKLKSELEYTTGLTDEQIERMMEDNR